MSSNVRHSSDRVSGRVARATSPGNPTRKPLLPSHLAEEAVEQAAARLRVMGHPVRLRLIELIARSPRPVSDLASAVGQSPDNTSKHLAELAKVGLVRRVADGNFAMYRLSDAVTLRLVALVCQSVGAETARLARQILAGDAQTPKGQDDAVRAFPPAS